MKTLTIIFSFICLISLTACQATNFDQVVDLTKAEKRTAEKHLSKITDVLGSYKLISGKKQFPKMVTRITNESNMPLYDLMYPQSIVKLIPINETLEDYTKQITFKTIHNIDGDDDRYSILEDIIKRFSITVGSNLVAAIKEEQKLLAVDVEGEEKIYFAKFNYSKQVKDTTEHYSVLIYDNNNKIQTMYFMKNNHPITSDESDKLNKILLILRKLHNTQSG